MTFAIGRNGNRNATIFTPTGRPFLRDAWWQMHCRLALDRPPRFVLEPQIAEDRFYRFLERTWMAQQLPWGLLFLALGGWPFVVWEFAVRVAVSLTGHWLIGTFRPSSRRPDVARRGRRRSGIQYRLLRDRDLR